MKALMHTFVKDMKLATRSFYIWIVLLFAVIFVGVMLFAVPTILRWVSRPMCSWRTTRF